MRQINRRTLLATLAAGIAMSGIGAAPALAKADEWEGPHEGLKVTWDDKFWEFGYGTTEEPNDWISIQGAGGNAYLLFHAEYIKVTKDFYDDFEDEALKLLHEYDQGEVKDSPAILEWEDADAIGYLFDRSFDDKPKYMCVEMSPIDVNGYALFTFYAIEGKDLKDENSQDALDGVEVNGHDPFVGMSNRKIIRAIRKDLESR